MKLLMYLVYGDNSSYYQEAKYSILSALSYLNKDQQDIEIIVVTDRPQSFANFPILIETFDEQRYQEWIGKDSYNHRAKNRSIAMILEKYKVPLVFIDTDTYFIKHPIEIFNKISTSNSVLFNQETPISECQNIYEKLQNTSFLDFYNKQYYFPDNAIMWNSGVIGLHPEHLILLDEALVLLDNLYRLSDGIFIVEQLAISEILRQKTTLHASDDIVVHYFGKEKLFYDQQIAYYLSQHTEKSLIEQPDSISKFKLSIPKPPIVYRFLKKLLHLQFKNKKLRKVLLELSYAQFKYKNKAQDTAKIIWLTKAIKHLHKLYDPIKKENNNTMSQLLEVQSKWVLTQDFNAQLIEQWHSLIKKYNGKIN